MTRSLGFSGGVVCACTLVVSLTPASAVAQAWLPGQGEGYVSAAFVNNNVGDHLFSSNLVFQGVDYGDSESFGEIDAQTLVVGLDYGLSRRWALSGSLAYVRSRYIGDLPESDLDDGSWNEGFQDASLFGRCRVTRGAVAFTPFIGVILPTRDYEVLGHSALGRNLNELDAGANLGWFHRPSKIYMQGRYTFAWVESVADQDLNRNELYYELGYYFNRRGIILGFTGYRDTAGGIDWLDEEDPDHPVGHLHDQAAALEDWRAGLGFNYRISERGSLFVTASTTLEGENTHETNLISFGTTWSFGGRRLMRAPGRPPDQQEAGAGSSRNTGVAGATGQAILASAGR